MRCAGMVLTVLLLTLGAFAQVPTASDDAQADLDGMATQAEAQTPATVPVGPEPLSSDDGAQGYVAATTAPATTRATSRVDFQIAKLQNQIKQRQITIITLERRIAELERELSYTRRMDAGGPLGGEPDWFTKKEVERKKIAKRRLATALRGLEKATAALEVEEQQLAELYAAREFDGAVTPQSVISAENARLSQQVTGLEAAREARPPSPAVRVKDDLKTPADLIGLTIAEIKAVPGYLLDPPRLVSASTSGRVYEIETSSARYHLIVDSSGRIVRTLVMAD